MRRRHRRPVRHVGDYRLRAKGPSHESSPARALRVGRDLQVPVPREQQVLTLRQHWAFLVPPAAAAAGAAPAAGAVTVIAPGATTLETVAWVLAGFLIARRLVAGLSWSVQYITITSERVVLTSGILNRKVKIIPLPNFAEMTFACSFAGRMIGYGAFMVEATGKPDRRIHNIPDPEQIQPELTEKHSRSPQEPTGTTMMMDPLPGGVQPLPACPTTAITSTALKLVIRNHLGQITRRTLRPRQRKRPASGRDRRCAWRNGLRRRRPPGR